MASVFAEQRGKLILAGVILLAAIGLFVFQSRGGAELTNSINFVCVATGKLYELDRDEVQGLGLPAVNPDTGQATLLPYAEKDGRRFITRRKARFLEQLADVNKYVDPKTLEVRVAP
jgi:hypothetical protein